MKHKLLSTLGPLAAALLMSLCLFPTSGVARTLTLECKYDLYQPYYMNQAPPGPHRQTFHVELDRKSSWYEVSDTIIEVRYGYKGFARIDRFSGAMNGSEQHYGTFIDGRPGYLVFDTKGQCVEVDKRF